jgi:hypothetical protein
MLMGIVYNCAWREVARENRKEEIGKRKEEIG